MKHSLNPRWERHRVFKRQKKTAFFSMFTSCNVNDHISSNLGRGQSRYHFKNCGGKNILHINKQLETTFSGKRLNLEEMPKTSPINQTHVLIQASTLFMVVAAGTAALKMISEGLLSMVLSIRGTGKLKIRVQKLYPNFWRKWPTSIPYLWLKRLKNNTLRTCAYLHSHIREYPLGEGVTKSWEIDLSRLKSGVTCNWCRLQFFSQGIFIATLIGRSAAKRRKNNWYGRESRNHCRWRGWGRRGAGVYRLLSMRNWNQSS